MIEDQIFGIVEYVWNAFVGIDLQRRSEGKVDRMRGYFLSSSVEIEGAWQGEVSLLFSEELAHRVASHLFEMPITSVSQEEIRETLGEISNIMGGNLKRLLPEPCHLSVPVVGFEEVLTAKVRGLPSHTTHQVLADCEGRLLVVMLAEYKPVVRQAH